MSTGLAGMTPGATPPAAWRRATHLAWRSIGDEVVLLDLRRHVVYGLSAGAASVLDWLAEPRRVPPGGPLGSFVEQLAANGLLEAGVANDSEPPAPAAPDARVLWQEPLATFALQCQPSFPQSVCGNPGCQS